MKSSILVTAVALSFAFPLAASAASGDTVRSSVSREDRILLRVCNNLPEDKKERCIVRQKQRLTYTSDRAKPTGAYEVYDGLDMGGRRIRSAQQRKILENAQANLRKRVTFRENPLEELSKGNQIVDYVDFIREGRLACMVGPHGRQRSKCLETLARDARALQQERLQNKSDAVKEENTTQE